MMDDNRLDNIVKCAYNMDNGYVEVWYVDENMLRPSSVGQLSPASQTGMIIPEGQVIRMSYAKYPKEMKEAVIARMLQGDMWP